VSEKFDLAFSRPILNAAGSLGYTPDMDGPVAQHLLGAFVTNPVSLSPRTPAHGKRLLSFPGGTLLHTGYPNPGLSAILKKYSLAWSRAALPVIVHLLVQSPPETAFMLERLEGLEGLMAVELGLDSNTDPGTARTITKAAVRVELPVIVRVPFERAYALGVEAMQAGAAAVSFAPPRGALPGEGNQSPPGPHLHTGRLYGPAFFPMVVELTCTLVAQDMCVIPSGGIYHPEQADSLVQAGALAVQIDSALWRAGVFARVKA